jgi:hypothetical protein
VIGANVLASRGQRIEAIGAKRWVPLVAGAKMIVLLGPHGVQVRWSREVCLEANRKLVDALQNGLTEGVGYYEDIGEYSPISAMEWVSLRPVISKGRLIPLPIRSTTPITDRMGRRHRS